MNWFKNILKGNKQEQLCMWIGADDENTCKGCHNAFDGNPYTLEEAPKPGSFECGNECRHALQLFSLPTGMTKEKYRERIKKEREQQGIIDSYLEKIYLLKEIYSEGMIMDDEHIDFDKRKQSCMEALNVFRELNKKCIELNIENSWKDVKAGIENRYDDIIKWELEWKNKEEMIKKVLQYIESNEGIKQSQLYKDLELSKEEIKYGIYLLERRGKIIKEKKGSSYALTAMKKADVSPDIES